MNKTRKEIISLISDYTDKTLSEGCFLKINNILIQHQVPTLDANFYKAEIYSNGAICIEEFSFSPLKRMYKYSGTLGYDGQIIGHYDLSALLKTIQSFGLMLVGFDGDYINFYSEANSKNYRILNKPLSLYNENEEKELLDLLLKLKNDFN